MSTQSNAPCVATSAPSAAAPAGIEITNNRGWFGTRRLRRHPVRPSPWAVNGVGYVMPSGYVKVCVLRPDFLIGLDYEHRVAYRETHGPIPAGWDVHHEDGNRSNNNPSNLSACPRGEHIRRHLSGKRRSHIVVGGVESKRCTCCGSVKPLAAFYERQRGVTGAPRYEPSCKRCKNDRRDARRRAA